MRLRDLEARFIKRAVVKKTATFVRDGADSANYNDADLVTEERDQVYQIQVDTLADADGIRFLCPLCFKANGGATGTHSVVCWFEDKVPDDAQPAPGRWNPVGTGIDDLTFVPGKKSNSVLLLGGCAWHGFVTNGDAT